MTIASDASPTVNVRWATDHDRPITAPFVPALMIELRECEDSADNADAKDPTERTDAAEPTEPIDATDPIEPIDSTDPRHPMHSIESSDHNDHFELMPASPPSGR